MDWPSYPTSGVGRAKGTSFYPYLGGKKLGYNKLANKGTMGLSQALPDYYDEIEDMDEALAGMTPERVLLLHMTESRIILML